jgi:hypothetical protein
MEDTMFNNDYLKESFDFWQGFTQSYADFMLDATQQSVEQSLNYRKAFDELVVDTIGKTQALGAQERGVALDLATTYSTNAQIAAEQAAELFKAVSSIMTAPLFTDWAVERVSQMAAAAAQES